MSLTLRHFAALLLCACSGEHQPLELDDYRLEVRGSNAWGSGLRFAVERDGAFRGYPPSLLDDVPPYVCDGRLDADERDLLTEAIDAAHLVWRWDDVGEACADGPSFRVELEARLDGGEIVRNQMRHADCSGSDSSMSRFLDRVDDLLAAHADRGDCTGCPVNLDGTCFPHATAPDTLCVNQLEIRCDAVTAGVVLDCDPDSPLECYPPAGWGHVYTWEVKGGTLWRWSDAGTTRFELALSLWANNPRDDAVILPDLTATLELVTLDGAPIPLGSDAASLAPLTLPPGSSNSYTITITGTAAADLLAAGSLFAAIEQRAEDAPLHTPLTLIDGPPG